MKNIIFITVCLFYINSYSQFGEQQIISTDVIDVTSVFASDIDGDGMIDVLSTSSGDNKLAWYKNVDGEGNFGEQQIISTNFQALNNTYTADIDGDGDLDVLASSNIDNKLAWFENLNGLGNFSEEQIIDINVYGFYSVFASDIDGDGDNDIIATTYYKIIWYENLNGQGGFSDLQVIYENQNPIGVAEVIAVDIDNDGDIDVFSGSQKGTESDVSWHENLDGLGNFGEKQIITTNIEVLKSIYAADIDGDNDMDVLSASRNDGKIAWYENTDGLGTFGAQQLISNPTEEYAFSVYTADLDNDGDMDVLSARGDDFITWYENEDGFGNFSEGIIISTEVDGAISVFAADLNNDGNIDVLSASYFDNKISWYENTTILGLQEVLLKDITLSPNPVKNDLQISTGNGITINSVQVYDVLSKQLLQTHNVSQIDVSRFTSGLLFVKITTDKGTVVKKVVKE